VEGELKMKVVKVDEGMRRQLATLGEEAILLDSAGNVLAHVITGERAKARLSEHATSLFDLEEATRIAAMEREGLPLSEVWKEIRAQESHG
jgi:hypothetical protein